jgi:hypothetical protein
LLSALPSIDAIEAELAQGTVGAAKDVHQDDDDGGSER